MDLIVQILHRRMVRLRQMTGNTNLKTQAMLDSKDVSGAALAKEILWRPMVLMFEPTLLVFNIYLALIYGTLIFHCRTGKTDIVI